MKLLFAWFVALLGLLVPTVCLSGPPADQQIDFRRDVRPILSDRCFACHGPDREARQADLRLDTEAAAKEDRGGYHVVVAGEPESSELYRRISADDAERMPPPDSALELTAQERETLRLWIEQGAVWTQHWAYTLPEHHPTPQVQDETWPMHWVDHFILARLERQGLRPSPDADPVTLARRLSFDLTGLPPTVDEVQRLVADAGPQSYERLVDGYLASAAFGERMALFWLDLVRYADTVGYHGDQDHNISPYRDYVIDAFNRNLEFDQFTREQLAGDLLPHATLEQRIATGYNRLLQTSHEGGVQEKEYLAIYAADRVRNLSAVWLGGTLGCAQCHDHKFDPYTTRDFYSLVAFFADVDEAQHLKRGRDVVPTPRPPEIEVLSRREREIVAQLSREIARLTSRLEHLEGERPAAGRSAEAERVRQEIQQREAQRAAVQSKARSTMITVSIEPRTIRILPRGNWLDDSGPVVQPAVPEFLGSLSGEARHSRLDLADWLVDPDRGIGLLTARVMVNRFWDLCFGRGIAPDLDDFGNQGQPPTHPELLDRLAIEFVDSGWDVKYMLKLLVMSRVYRQTSRVSELLQTRDPGNQLFGRQARFRLPAEMIRDNALAISGLLVRRLGGASVRPYQPEGYYRHLNFPKRTYEHHSDDRQWRRGVYMHWQRQFLHPMLKAFDAPSREECTAERPQSNTPLAALTLLNDPTFVEAARVFAQQILQQGGDTVASRLEYAVRRALGREPDSVEQEVLAGLLCESAARFQTRPAAAAALIDTGLAPVAADLDPIELASWTTVARAILNLNETNMRN